jgi:hypothetical protein
MGRQRAAHAHDILEPGLDRVEPVGCDDPLDGGGLIVVISVAQDGSAWPAMRTAAIMVVIGPVAPRLPDASAIQRVEGTLLPVPGHPSILATVRRA